MPQEYQKEQMVCNPRSSRCSWWMGSYHCGCATVVTRHALIKSAIHDNFQSYNNRTANISLQAYYAAEQARILAIHILRFVTDLVDSPDELVPIITAAQDEAWKHMTNLNRHKSDAQVAQEDDEEWQL
jgi:hypothetical protein